MSALLPHEASYWARFIRTHSPNACVGQPCPVHNPSDHHMRQWPLNYRSDRGITERLCPAHGIGHPDPDCIRSREDDIHGCCGCCNHVKAAARQARVSSNVQSVRELFRDAMSKRSYVIDKTGVKTLEIIGASFVADEPAIFGTVDQDYVAREIAWYRSCSLNVNDITGKVPEIWRRVATPDGRINSNYGWCIWSEKNGNQYQRCLTELIGNRDSRRAIMIYTRPSMHQDFSRDGMSDFMCTNAVQYLIRDGVMHAVVQMRSNDAVYGYKNDRAWAFTVLHDLVSDYNRLTESKVDVGPIHWNVGSLHVYERHFSLIKA